MADGKDQKASHTEVDVKKETGARKEASSFGGGEGSSSGCRGLLESAGLKPGVPGGFPNGVSMISSKSEDRLLKDRDNEKTDSQDSKSGARQVVTPMALAKTDDGAMCKNGDAKLLLPDGREICLEIIKGTMGDEVIIDIQSLFNKHSVLMLDPGFNSTAACKSAVTYINGDLGDCRYRGYSVHELVEHHDFLDVCHLLLYGELPSRSERVDFETSIKAELLVHSRLKDFVSTFVPGAHPMSILASVLSAMASFYADPMSASSMHDQHVRDLACVRLIAKIVCQCPCQILDVSECAHNSQIIFPYIYNYSCISQPTIVAMAYKVLIGEPMVYPRSDLTYAENFLYMMFASPTCAYRVNPLHAEVIDAFLMIHADHEQNASTSTVRTAGSSLANPYACIATGVTSLWGRAHGGANEAVIDMLTEIGSEENVPAFVERVKRREVRLMGFGHRVYKNYDPRAKIMQELCGRVFSGLKSPDPLFPIARALEAHAMQDQYFISRRLYPNVDFYSGIVMRALGIPKELFTVMFAMGRCVGWLAHWQEMVMDKQFKITRPRQLYVGNVNRDLPTGRRSPASRRSPTRS